MSAPAASATTRRPSVPDLVPREVEERKRRTAPLVLLGIFLVGAAYHALQSRAHLTPAIFTDELLYSKLAQSLAAGQGLSVRGESFFFPAPLAALVQAPVWLVESVPAAYALAKALNAVVMASAAFPAYWLARHLVRERHALLVAAAAVAAPGLVYHSYLMSEALAYPLFLLGLAVVVRALVRPSLGWGLTVLGVSLLCVGTRIQLAALPLAYLLVLPLVPRRDVRRHVLPAGVLLAAGAAVLLTRGAAVGPYGDVLEYAPLDVLRWSGYTAALLPFAAGWIVVPGAILGLWQLLSRPRARAERPFAALVATLVALVLLQVGYVAAVDSERPLERYAIYLVPLLFVAFFAYVERGAPARRAYVGLALALGLLAWAMPFPSLADFRFSFDSPTLSAYGMLAIWLGHANAATLFAAVPFAVSVALAFAGLRGRRAPAFAAGSIALAALLGAAAYAGDHAMTRRTLDAWAGTPPSWLDEFRAGRADYLALAGGSPHFGWTLEAWNRNVGRVIRLRVERPRTDPFAASRAAVRADGVLAVGGRPLSSPLLVVNDYATAVDLDGDVVARARPGLTLYRTEGQVRIRSLAEGLFHDGWGANIVRYQVWPRGGATSGTYRVRLEIPRGRASGTIALAVEGGGRRTVALRAGESKLVELEAEGRPVPPLRITSDFGNYFERETPNPRLVSVRVPLLEYVPD